MKKVVVRLLDITLLVAVVFVSSIGAVRAQGQAGGMWTDKAPMPTPRKEIANATAALDGKVYVVGGVASSGMTTAALEVYDPLANTWSEGASLPLAVWRAASAVLDGQLYVFGGYRTSQFPFSPSTRVFVYDPATNVWTEKAPMSQARGAMVAVVFDGKIHVMGGLGGPNNTALSLHEVYDPATDEWQTQTPMPRVRSGHTAAVMDGLIYLAGGYRLSGGVVSQNFFDAYDPVTQAWQPLQPLPTARHGIAAAVVQNKMYVFGGNMTASVSSASLEYDPAMDTWRQVSQMPSPVSFMGVAAVGDTIYVIGGGPVNLNRLDGVNLNRAFVPADLSTAVEDVPERRAAVQLHANYPNPFIHSTTIQYEVAKPTFVRLEVFDLMGRRVATLIDRQVSVGVHTGTFDVQGLAGGTYLLRLAVEGQVQTAALQIIR